MIRGIPLILIALLIDFFQAGLSAGIIGASSLVSWIPIVGQLATTGGTVLSIAINVCISLTFGSFLVILMIFSGMFSLRILPAFLEVLPGFSIFPAWTAATVYCVLKKSGIPLTRSTVSKTAGLLAKQLGSNSPSTGRLGTATAAASSRYITEEEPRAAQEPMVEEGKVSLSERAGRVSSELRNIDGIRKVAASAFLFFAIFTGNAGAQTIGSSLDQIRVLSTPELPGPNETVHVQVQGVGNFLGDATINWQQNGSTVKSGVGERTYTFTTGSLGSVTRITITIDSSTQGIITRELTFIPSLVNLVWEANTSVPPLYRGKALYSIGSEVRVIAFPQIISNGATISSNNLTFNWELNGDPVPAQSGKGRNTLTFAGDQFKEGESVAVDVFLGSVQVGQGVVYIPAVDPQIRLYPRDPLRGVLWSEALPSSISLGAKEIAVQAVPYFFANESFGNGSLAYAWTLNNRTTTGPDAARGILTLRQSGEGTGEARLGVSLQNLDNTKLLQAAEAAVRIIFGAQTSSGFTSFFGL